MKKVITVVVPTYNEEANVQRLYERTNRVFREQLPNYICNIQFIDNCSTDNTRTLIRELCEKDETVTAIFNAKNFGFVRSQFYGLSQAAGDAAVLMCADMQDPPEVIPQFVAEWEKGYKIVAGIKNKSKENPLMYLGRKMYYSLIRQIADVDHIDQFDGFGLYDRSFVKVLRDMDDPLPYLRGIVAELGFRRKDVNYEQERRLEGKSHFHFLSLYDLAMLGITSYSKVVMHLVTLTGAAISAISILVALYVVIMKLTHWTTYPFGTAAMQVGIFVLGSLQLFTIGFVGEYIVNMNTRVMHHPLVIEEARINFEVMEHACAENGRS